MKRVLFEFGRESRRRYDAADTDRLYDDWRLTPGAVIDYSHDQFQRAYTEKCLILRMDEILDFLDMACGTGTFAGGPSAPEPFSDLLQASSVNVVGLGCGPAAELWSLLYFLTRRNGPAVSAALLVDFASWGATILELQDQFFKQISSHAAPTIPAVSFWSKDLAFASEPQQIDEFIGKLDQHRLNLVFIQNLEWDFGRHRIRSWFSGLLESIGSCVPAEVFVSMLDMGSELFQAPSGWTRRILMEEGERRKRRNFYCFKQTPEGHVH